MLVTCPECSKRLKVPDSAAGKKIRCPGCSGPIPVPARTARRTSSGAATGRPAGPRRKSAAAAEPAPARPVRKKKRPARRREEPNPFADDGFDDLDDFGGSYGNDPYGDDDYGDNPYATPKRRSGGRKKRGGRGRAGMEKVGTGLLVQAWAFMAIVIMGALVVLFAAARIEILAGLAALGFAGVLLLSLPAILIGELLCLSAPEDSGAKGLIIGAVACQIVGFILNVANRANPGVMPLAIAASLISVASMVLWLWFLRTIADYAGKSNLATQATILLGACFVWWIMSIVITVMLVMNPALFIAMGWGLFIGACLFGILLLVWCVSYVSLLFRLGSALRG